jgi:antitoxin component YwqK of YwqJK toxin-antitoxin module
MRDFLSHALRTLGLALLLIVPAPAQEDDKATQDDRVLLIASPEDAPNEEILNRLTHKRWGKYRGVFEEGLSVKIVLYENLGDDKIRFKRTVSLDEKSRKHGTEILYRKLPNHWTEEIEWKHGVKHGTQVINMKDAGLVEIPWVDGVIQGEKTSYFKGRERIVRAVTPYVDGEPHGVAKSYDRDGNLLSRTPNRHGHRHGDSIEYFHGTEQPKRIIPYVEGRAHGTARFYYQDGSLKREIELVDDLFHGMETQYMPDGTVTRKIYWWEGDRVPEARYKARANASEG